MTLYRLPEWLGGGEFESVGVHHDDHGESMILLNVPGVGRQLMPSRLLESLLPPEPPDGATLACDDVVFLRRDGWYSAVGEERWYHTLLKHDGPWTWAQVVEFAPSKLVPLVPDPVASAPELPMVLGDPDEPGASVGFTFGFPDDDQMINISADGSYTIDEAESLGSAILRAACEARKATGGTDAR